MICQMIFVVFFSFCNSGKQPGLNNKETSDNTRKKKAKMESEKHTSSYDTTKEDSISQLIQQLNFWMQQGGDADHRLENVKSTGESNAAFEEIRKKLDSLEVKYQWKDNRYLLEE